MSTSDFQKIGTFANPADADQIRAILEEHGIPAFVEGANSSTMLNHIGSALGGVGVLVRGEDAQQAAEVLASLEEVSGEAWFCGRCQEPIDAGFHVCWSCGAPRGEVEAPFPETPDVSETAEEERQGSYPHESGPTFELSAQEARNPFASPRTRPQVTDTDEPRHEIDPEAEAMLLRAWRASILGVVFLPVLAHLYAMYLLMAAAQRSAKFSPEGDRRFLLTLLVCVLGGGVWGVILVAVMG